jgi:hypothetical protein
MTVIALTSFLTQVDNLISADNNELAEIRRQQQIKAALQRYSKDRPDIQTDDVSGDGGKYYALTTALFASWIEDFSRVLIVEYPAATIASDETPILLDPVDWQDDYFADISGTLTRHLFFPNHSPGASETMRISYTVPYTWSTGSTTTNVRQVANGFAVNNIVYQNKDGKWISTETDTSLLGTHIVTTDTDADNVVVTDFTTNIPSQDFFAVCALAACLVCKAIAGKYSRTTDSTIAADSVNHTTRAEQFREQANEFCNQYNDHMGLADEGAGAAEEESLIAEKPAGTYVDWDTAPGWPQGRDFLYHGAGHR